MRVLVNPTPIVSIAPVGAVFESSFGVVVSLHANAPAATATTAIRTRRGLAAEVITSATWDNETRCSEIDIVTPNAGLSVDLSFTSETESPGGSAHFAGRDW